MRKASVAYLFHVIGLFLAGLKLVLAQAEAVGDVLWWWHIQIALDRLLQFGEI